MPARLMARTASGNWGAPSSFEYFRARLFDHQDGRSQRGIGNLLGEGQKEKSQLKAPA